MLLVIEVKNALGAGQSVAKSIKQLKEAKKDLEAWFAAEGLEHWVYNPMIYTEKIEVQINCSECKKFIMGFFPMCPYKKYIVDIPKPYQWFFGTSGQEIVFNKTHEQVGVRWSHFCTHGCTTFLQVVCISKSKDVTVKNESNEFHDDFNHVD